MRHLMKFYDPNLHLLEGGIKLIDQDYLNPAIVGSRLGAGMTQNAAGDWVWGKHNYAPNLSGFSTVCTIAPYGVYSDGVTTYSFTPNTLGVSVAGAGGESNRCYFQQNSIPAGQPVANSMFVRSIGGIHGKVSVKVAQANTDTELAETTITTTNDWQRVTASAVIPTTGLRINMKSEQAVEVYCPQINLGNVATDPWAGSGSFPLIWNDWEKGWRMWGQTTNLQPWSGSVNMWAISGGTGTTIAEPENAQTSGFSPVRVTNSSGYFRQANLVVAAATYTQSVFAYGSGTVDIIIDCTGTRTGGCNGTLNLTTGVFTGTGTVVVTGSTNTWRVSSTVVSSTGGTFFIRVTPSAYIVTWQSQLETGTTASPPIPTCGSSATCAADVCTVPLAATGLTDAQGCVVARFRSSVGAGQYGIVFGGSGSLNTYQSSLIVVFDGTQSVSNALDSTTYKTACGSFGAAGITLDIPSVSKTGTYDGSFVTNPMTIGANNIQTQFINGYIQELWTIPTQPNVTDRSKLAKLWS